MCLLKFKRRLPPPNIKYLCLNVNVLQPKTLTTKIAPHRWKNYLNSVWNILLQAICYLIFALIPGNRPNQQIDRHRGF